MNKPIASEGEEEASISSSLRKLDEEAICFYCGIGEQLRKKVNECMVKKQDDGQHKPRRAPHLTSRVKEATMNIMISVNLWFLVSLCLMSVLIGALLFARVGGRDRRRY
jgi:hypothetical protein